MVDRPVYVAEVCTRKDGLSDDSAMVTAIVSVLTQTSVRSEVAMTGEGTLRGRVLPIGGLKEKLLAALRAGIKTVLIPQENEKDLADITDNVKRKLEIVPVSDCDEVLARALVKELTPNEWTESKDDVKTTRTRKGEGEQSAERRVGKGGGRTWRTRGAREQ